MRRRKAWGDREPVDQPAPAQFSNAPGQRHFGMDWLRIGAFALLILYHIAMVFAPWHWVVKARVTYGALVPPMALLTPWRLALLFAVSGYASRKLLARSGSLRSFLTARNARLLIPLAFGMAVLVPIETWVQVREGGYGGSYLHFWAQDYWRRGSFYGRSFPSWEHLWFVAYLWAYTLALGAVVAVAGERWGAALLARLERGRRLLWLPALVLGSAKLALMFVVPEQQGLFSDWSGHAEYWPIFAFGFVVAGEPRAWAMLARVFRPAIALAVAAGAVTLAIELAWPADAVPPHLWAAIDRAARVTMAWSMVLALFHAAERWLNRDHRWRRPLAEAVFPAYLLHHPAIVLLAWWSAGWPPGIECAVLVVGSLAVCASGYLLGRRVPMIGALIGLKGVAPAAASARAPDHDAARLALDIGDPRRRRSDRALRDRA